MLGHFPCGTRRQGVDLGAIRCHHKCRAIRARPNVPFGKEASYQKFHQALVGMLSGVHSRAQWAHGQEIWGTLEGVQLQNQDLSLGLEAHKAGFHGSMGCPCLVCKGNGLGHALMMSA